MKNLKKKGFTIVELVIVIAVIAILSAVLIPTFSSLIKKANLSADEQAVRELNNGLVIGSIEGDPQSIDDVANMLNEAGYNSFESLAPISKGYNFYWLKNTNQIVLVEVETGEVAFSVKGDEVNFSAELAAGNAFNLKRVAGEVEVTNEDDAVEALEKGQSIKLTSDLNIDNTIIINKGEDVVIDLGIYTITAPTQKARPFTLREGSKLTINASENANEITCGEYGLVRIEGSNTELVLNGGNYKANTSNGAFIRPINEAKNVKIILNNVCYQDTSSDGFIMNINGAGDNISIEVNGGEFSANAGFQVQNGVFKNVKITTNCVAYEISGNATLDTCTINVGSSQVSTAPSACIAVSYNGTANVTGCTLDGDGNTVAAYYVYSSGGSITASNNNVDLSKFKNEFLPNDLSGLNEGKSALIVIDGVEKLNISK